VRPSDYDACTDEQLLASYTRGDVLAMAALLRRYKRPLFTFVLRLNGDRHRAEDLLQEVFVRLIEHAHSYEGSARVKTWLYRIARNLSIDEMRRGKHRRHASLDASERDGQDNLHQRVADAAPAADRRAASGQLKDRIAQAIAGLPQDQREVFLLRQVEQLSFKEIAEITTCSENTVKSRMRYALARLQSALSEYQEYAEELR
jgi:RNA polymerase sigma-70 factor (ECF subfamily)